MPLTFANDLRQRQRNILAIILLLVLFVIADISALKYTSWHQPSTSGEIPVPREGLGLAGLRGLLYIFAGKTGSDGKDVLQVSSCLTALSTARNMALRGWRKI